MGRPMPHRRSAANLSAPVRGALWMVTAAFFIVAFTTVARRLSGEVPVAQMVFFRGLFGLMFLAPWMLRVGWRGLRTNRLRLHLLRGVSGIAGLFLLLGAVGLMPVADVLAINFTRPIFASVVAVMVLGEVFHARRWTALTVGFAGTMIILRPGFEALNMGAAMALAGAATGVSSAICTKSLTRTETPDAIACYAITIYFLLSIVPAVLVWQTPSWEQLGWLVVLGGLATGFQRTNARAFAAADATVVLPFEFARLPLAAALGFVVFAELPDGWTWVGGAVIFVAGLYLSRRESAAAA